MGPKLIVKSKTFWFNVLGIALEVTNLLPLPPSTALVISNTINIVLRIFTKEPVKVMPS
jgi:hypothetical protein